MEDYSVMLEQVGRSIVLASLDSISLSFLDHRYT
jgi:hypothetical protein